jgi:hypothetical protein
LRRQQTRFFASYFLWSVLLLVPLPFLEGCGVKYVNASASPNFNDYPVKKIAVLPFQSRPTPVEDKITEVRQVAEGAEEFLTQLFVGRLEATGRYQVIPQGQIENVLKTSPPDEPGVLTASLIQKVGKTLAADAVILGRVLRFIERVGGSVGSDHPASVGLAVMMISTRDGQVLWSSEYFETQQTLTENINTLPLFIKRGGKWLTARELAAYGLDEMIKTLPKKKE